MPIGTRLKYGVRSSPQSETVPLKKRSLRDARRMQLFVPSWHSNDTHCESRELAMKTITQLGQHSWIAALLLFATTFAGSCPADSIAANEKTTWGNTPGLTAPKPDSKGRAGHWWWPKPLEHDKKGGNGGRVFAPWTPVEETISVEPTPPYPEEPSPLEPERRLILNNVLFPSDSAELTKWAKAELERTVAELTWWFERYRNDKIICIGHTDDIGRDSYNMDLGLRRAKAVADYLISQGIGADFVQAKSVGEPESIVPNDTPTNRALNRCVEFWIEIGQ